MELKKTAFYKDTLEWSEKFRKLLRSRPIEFWQRYMFDVNKYVDKIYMLHLPHQINRVENIEKTLSSVRAPNGSLFDHVTLWEGSHEKTKWDHKIHEPEYSLEYAWKLQPSPELEKNLGRLPSIHERENFKITCSLQESNIAIGHLSILQDIVDNNHAYALILEDDIKIRDGFSFLITRALKELPEDWDILYVSYQPVLYDFKSEPYSDELVKIQRGVWWMSGVFVSQRAAKKLVSNLPIIGPIDVWINYHFDDLNVFGTKYNYIGQNETINSNNKHSYPNAIKNMKINKDI